MARRCGLTGKGVLTGNTVSHAHNKARRRFLPNLQTTSVYSEALGYMVRLRISTSALRTIEHNGGLDAYLASVKDAHMSPQMRRLKRRIAARRATQPAAS